MLRADLEGRTLGEFTLGPLLSSGGHGAVYQAEQLTLRRDVVIKVLQVARRRDPRARERFLQEARLASSLDHPYAAHVYAFGVEDDGLMWLAMEYVHGVTLHEWLNARGPMTPAQFVPFYEKVAQVVHAAHRLGIVHRDLKPSNVMVIERDGVLLPKLLDFGIAKGPAEGVASLSDDLPDVPQRVPEDTARLQVKPSPFRGEPTPTAPPSAPCLAPEPRAPGQMTASGEGIGSYPYMAPELWTRARHAGPAADVYALGAMAFRLLVGCDPFIATRIDDYRQLHTHAPVPPLGDPLRVFEPVIRRAMAKQPAERYPSALDLSDELAAALRHLDREQLRTAAQQWADRRQSPGLLWGPEELHELDHWRRTTNGLSPLECSFVAASQRRARRAVWFRRVVVAAAVLVAAGGFQYRATMRTRIAEERADATITQAELEQGRYALLHGAQDAADHLARAYAHDPTPSTAFMLARALQPRLAEQLRLPATTGRMWSAVFSPDGRWIATSDDRHARVWDATSGHLVRTLPHDANVYQVAYSVDGTTLYTAAGDGAVRVWDAASGALVRRLARTAGDDMTIQFGAFALSPDKRAIAAVDINHGVLDVWDLAGRFWG